MKKKNHMLIKVAVALAGITLTVLVLFFTPLWGTAILLSFLSGMCCFELCIPTGAIREKPVVCGGVIVAVLLPWIWYFEIQSVALPLCALLLITGVFLYYAAKKENDRSKTIAWLFFSAILFPAFFSMLLPILASDGGKRLVLIPFIAAWSTDTGAQFAGRLFGKHKLAPQISPNKTVEGFFGGLFGGVLGMAVYLFVLRFMHREAPVVSLLAFGLVSALFATVGDLFFSYIKREHEIKDYGALMPEHGGVMDRFDSVVFVIPLLYMNIRIFPIM